MKKIYLIDWYSFIYRMFFAMPEFTNSSWEIVNAVFGIVKFFLNQLLKLNPDYIIFIKDAPWDNFRHELYSEYKATRDRMPDNLRNQLKLIDEFLEKINQKVLSISWYEADDVIATIATSLAKEQNNQIFILSSDKDLYSLVNEDNIKIFDFAKQTIFWYEEAQEKFDVKPEYIIDYLAIVWDSADNIPWISWFWPKKAVDLIKKYSTIENIFNHINDEDFLIKWKTLETLKTSYDIAILSKKLATLEKNVFLKDFDLKDYIFDEKSIYTTELIDFLKYHNFSSLLPVSEKKYKTYKDLKYDLIEIKSKERLEILIDEIKKSKNIFFYISYTDAKIIYDTQITSFWIKINSAYYYCDISIVEKKYMIIFFDFLINQNDTKIIVYDKKKTLKLIDIFKLKLNKNEKKSFWQLTLIQ